jgi:general secretion pathway protein D
MLRYLITMTIAPNTWQQITPGATPLGATPLGATPTGATPAGQPVEFDPTRGTIEFYQNKYMIVRHTLEVQQEIEKLINQMRKALGEQVSIEARFLVVGENFLEDIGIDFDLMYDAGAKGKDRIDFAQSSYDAAAASASKLPGSLAGSTVAALVTGGYGNIVIDDLQVDFLIKATQAHRDSKLLTAPKVTVLSGEMAAIEVQTTKVYPSRIVAGSTTYAGGLTGYGGNWFEPEMGTIVSGPTLSVTPIITKDKKHVLLNIVAELQDIISLDPYKYEIPPAAAGDLPTPVEVILPQTELSRVQTRVSVPDGGTLLLGGLKITAEEEREVGVPGLSKLPLLGRLFDNRSKVRDNKILLILVKPTIILQEEKDAEAVAALEAAF